MKPGQFRCWLLALFLGSAGPLCAQEALWKTYLDVGEKANTAKNYGTAETMFLAALAEAKQFGANDQRVATTMIRLGSVYFFEKKNEQAAANYRGAIEIWEKAGPPPISEQANALNDFGIVLSRLNRLEESEQIYQRALPLGEKLDGPASPKLIIPLTNQAMTLESEAKLGEAELRYRRALEIAEKNAAVDPKALLTSLRMSARNLAAQKKFEAAAPIFSRAREMAEGSKNSTGSEIAGTLLEGNNFSRLGRTAEADGRFKQSIAAYEKLKLQSPLALASALESYANFLRQAGRAADAKPLETRAAALRKTAQ